MQHGLGENGLKKTVFFVSFSLKYKDILLEQILNWLQIDYNE